MDWATRKVLLERTTNTLNKSFCIDALEEALFKYGKPEIFNTDQGALVYLFKILPTCSMRTRSESAWWQRQMDGGVFIKRLWRNVKYEDVCLKSYELMAELRAGPKAYFAFYNGERRHQALDYRTPDDVYYGIVPQELVAA